MKINHKVTGWGEADSSHYINIQEEVKTNSLQSNGCKVEVWANGPCKLDAVGTAKDNIDAMIVKLKEMRDTLANF
jgi:hypothetical protein